jgi:hypothetical protein
MRVGILLLLSIVAACKESSPPPRAETMRPPSPVPADAQVLGFESDAPGKPPAGFSSGLTGQGRPGAWQVQTASDAAEGRQVVVQTDADSTNYRFPVLVYDGAVAVNVDLSVRFEPVSGRVDQAAGLVWRYLDADNYYVVRANALEDNVVLYKVEEGQRRDLAVRGMGRSYGVKAPVPDDGWSTLRVTATGPLFEVYLNGAKLFEVEDPTLTRPGKVGLWTKADSVTRFDDLRVAVLDSPGAARP